MALQATDSALKARVISGVAMAVIALIAIIIGGWLFTVLICVVNILAVFEWSNLRHIVAVSATKKTATPTPLFVLMAIGTLLPICIMASGAAETAWITLFIMAAVAHGAAMMLGVPASKEVAPSLLYFGAAALSFVWLRDVGGPALIGFLVLVVIATDIGGYVVGRKFRGKKLAPVLSPGKTWSGLYGCIVSAFLIGGMTAQLLLPGPPIVFACIAAGLAVVAQGGDLLESAIKRAAEVKDSSNLIPGHGGVLDRVDGLLSAAPVFALIIWLGDFAG